MRQDEFPDRKFKAGRNVGIIAQELEPILPEAVTTDENTGFKYVSYTYLIPVLIEAIKEQVRLCFTK
jgi:hypothetical protein